MKNSAKSEASVHHISILCNKYANLMYVSTDKDRPLQICTVSERQLLTFLVYYITPKAW